MVEKPVNSSQSEWIAKTMTHAVQLNIETVTSHSLLSENMQVGERSEAVMNKILISYLFICSQQTKERWFGALLTGSLFWGLFN